MMYILQWKITKHNKKQKSQFEDIEQEPKPESDMARNVGNIRPGVFLLIIIMDNMLLI